MKTACMENKIPLVSWRYSYLDEKVKAFNPQIAKLQYNAFLGKKKNILSNQEASKQIQANKKLFILRLTAYMCESSEKWLDDQQFIKCFT